MLGHRVPPSRGRSALEPQPRARRRRSADRLTWSHPATGSTARTSVPVARRALDAERPVAGADAVRQAAQPRPDAGARAADAVVADLDHERAVLDCASRTEASDARAYFATFVSASETVKYAVTSSVGESRSIGSADDLDRHRRAAAERLDRGQQPAFCEHRGVDAAGQLAQLRRGLGQLLARAGRGTGPAESGAVRAGLRATCTSSASVDEPLLRAVVQVALDLAPRRVGRGDDAGARGAQLGGARCLDLAPPQRLLGLAALGDVEDHAVHPEPAAEAGDELAAVEHLAHRAVGAHDPVLLRERVLVVARGRDLAHHLVRSSGWMMLSSVRRELAMKLSAGSPRSARSRR